MHSLISLLAATFAALYLAGRSSASPMYYGGNPCDGVPSLTCFLKPTASATLEGSPSSVTGSALFSPEASWSYYNPSCKARITGTIYGLGDATPHGWHIHTSGDISEPDGTGTGGHFNPAGVDHALPAKGGGNVRHVGDLGNLYPDDKGVATFDFTLDIELDAVRGRGLIIHAVEDDGGQPTGNAGARLAQCVLGVIE